MVCPKNPHEGDLLCMNPPKFLKEYKNPCWRSESRELNCLPYFQLIGMDKSASSDLFDRILKHPDIIGNNGTSSKETEWWSWRRYGYGVLKDRAEKPALRYYVGYFSNSSQFIDSPEKTDPNGYHFGVTGMGHLTPHLIKHVNPDIKLIIIMRNPIDRLYSDYYFMNLSGNSSEAFNKSVAASIQYLNDCLNHSSLRLCLFSKPEHLRWSRQARIHIGFYSEFLQEWLKVFPKEHFLFLRTEDYTTDVNTHLEKVSHFLNVRPLSKAEMSEFEVNTETRKNITASKLSNGPMMNETRRILSQLYEPYNVKLAKMLNDHRFLWKNG